MESQSVQKSDALDYKSSSSVQPTYQFLQVFQQSGLTTSNTTAGTEMLFEIPTKVVNLSKSELVFTATPTAAAATYYNRLFTSMVPWFNQVQLYTRGGLYLADIRYSNFANTITNKACTSLDEELTNDLTSGGLTRINSDGTTRRVDGTTANLPYTEIKYVEQGAITAAEPVITYKIPLKNIGFESILELDKDLYFGEVLILRFVLNAQSSVGFRGTNENNVSNGAAALAGVVSLSAISLRIACEKDQMIEKSVMDKANSGMSLVIPYIHAFKTNLAASANHTVTLRLNRAHGHSLMRVYHSSFLAAPAVNTVYDNNNKADNKISQYYSMLDNQRIQQFDLDTSLLDDYEYHRDLLKNSAMQNANVYQTNWFHCDDFTGFKSPAERKKIYEQNVVCGIPLDVERKWDIYMTTPGAVAYDYYTVAVCQRTLTIGSGGMTLL